MDNSLPGDVILYSVTPKSGWTSKFVVIAEIIFGIGNSKEEYSHATILSDLPGHEFGAQWPWSGHFPIDKSRPYEIWRLNHPSGAQRNRILDYAREHCGEWYNMIGLLTGGLLGLRHTAVCSQFVGNAYAAAGIKISPEGRRLVSPNAIRDFPSAEMVHSYEP